MGAVNVSYFLGGYLPDAPALNQDERWDEAAATYTRWDKDGNVIEQRALTDAETAALQAE